MGNFLQKNAGVTITLVLEALIGALLLINPLAFTTGILIAFGAVLLVMGIVHIICYFRMDPLEAAGSQALMRGLVLVVVGGFLVFRSKWFIVTFPLLTIVYGVVVLIAGLSKIQWAVDALRLHADRWYLPAISAAISIICAIVILMNPFATTLVLWQFAGATLVVEAILDLLVLIFHGRSRMGMFDDPEIV